MAFQLALPRLEDQLPSLPFHRCPGALSSLKAAGQEGGGGGDDDGDVEVIAAVAAAVVVVVVVVDSLRVSNVDVGVHGGPSVILRHLLGGQ